MRVWHALQAWTLTRTQSTPSVSLIRIVTSRSGGMQKTVDERRWVCYAYL